MNNELIQALREMQVQLEKTTRSSEQVRNHVVNYEKQISHMIETYPEIWGKGGLKRNVLERKAEEYGIDGDLGINSDHGPANN